MTAWRPRDRRDLRDLAFFLRGRLTRRLHRLLRRRRPDPLPAPVPLDRALAGGRRPIDLVPLLESRPDPEREAAVRRYLEERDLTVARHHFDSFEGRGENLAVEMGHGERVLVLIAHHDAVPGSPGANDNAAAVAVLLQLLARLRQSPPRSIRVRLLFTACEERGYLGARWYVRDVPVGDVLGVVSLELCGIGDTLALWDVGEETPFGGLLRAGFEASGLRPDDTYHVVGRIPVFGSDHRAFAAQGIPAYGLSIVPAAQAEALRQFVLSPLRSAAGHLTRRPPPFDTYHTSGDRLSTLDPRALDHVLEVLTTIVGVVAAAR